MPAVCHIIRMQRTLSAWLFVQIIVCLRFWRICRNIDMHMSMQSCDEKIPEEPKPSRMLLTSLFIVPVSCRLVKLCAKLGGAETLCIHSFFSAVCFNDENHHQEQYSCLAPGK